MFVLSECRLMVNALGVTADKVSVTFWVPAMLTVPGEKLTVAFTCTVTLEGP